VLTHITTRPQPHQPPQQPCPAPVPTPSSTLPQHVAAENGKVTHRHQRLQPPPALASEPRHPLMRVQRNRKRRRKPTEMRKGSRLRRRREGKEGKGGKKKEKHLGECRQLNCRCQLNPSLSSKTSAVRANEDATATAPSKLDRCVFFSCFFSSFRN
jgi:hypothetical protein